MVIETHKDDGLVEVLAKTEEDKTNLREAITVIWAPFDHPLQKMQSAYQLLGYYYARVKSLKREARSMDDAAPDLLFRYQLFEDILEAYVKGIKEAIIIAQHLNKNGGF